MREMQIEGWKLPPTGDATVQVLYKGPFRAVTDDAGTVFSRGEWVRVPSAITQGIKGGAAAEQFVVQ